jgi:hypothetical protein
VEGVALHSELADDLPVRLVGADAERRQ